MAGMTGLESIGVYPLVPMLKMTSTVRTIHTMNIDEHSLRFWSVNHNKLIILEALEVKPGLSDIERILQHSQGENRDEIMTSP